MAAEQPLSASLCFVASKYNFEVTPAAFAAGLLLCRIRKLYSLTVHTAWCAGRADAALAA
jgi:hypothetical protein